MRTNACGRSTRAWCRETRHSAVNYTDWKLDLYAARWNPPGFGMFRDSTRRASRVNLVRSKSVGHLRSGTTRVKANRIVGTVCRVLKIPPFKRHSPIARQLDYPVRRQIRWIAEGVDAPLRLYPTNIDCQFYGSPAITKMGCTNFAWDISERSNNRSIGRIGSGERVSKWTFCGNAKIDGHVESN